MVCETLTQVNLHSMLKIWHTCCSITPSSNACWDAIEKNRSVVETYACSFLIGHRFRSQGGVHMKLL